MTFESGLKAFRIDISRRKYMKLQLNLLEGTFLNKFFKREVFVRKGGPRKISKINKWGDSYLALEGSASAFLTECV